MNEINLLKNNTDRKLDDVDWVQEFFDFLKGQTPEGVSFRRGHAPKISPKKAFAIIYYLQEHLPVFPDHIEMCWNCGKLFDSYLGGVYWQSKERNYCDVCGDLVPIHHDRGNAS